MALPRIDTPTYQIKLPSTGQTINYRPFLVKEQKIIMMAQETEDEEQMLRAMSDLVTSCTFNQVDVNNLPMYDVEYLFLRITSLTWVMGSIFLYSSTSSLVLYFCASDIECPL